METGGDGNLCQGTGRRGRIRGKAFLTVNEIEATEGGEKARSHEEDMKSSRQAEKKGWEMEEKNEKGAESKSFSS